jgi:hypothetical protein
MALNNTTHLRLYFRVSRKYFNMIEVTLAIAIVALGMVGILALFPVGLQSTRDAIGDNYVNDASQLFLSYIKLSAKSVASPPTQASIDTAWNTLSVIPTAKPDPAGSVDTVNPSLTGFTETAAPNVYSSDTTPGLYRVYQGSSDVNDFKAAVRIWKALTVSPIHTNHWDKWSPSDYSKSCGLNIEFSWPVEKPYNVRMKRFFYYELFKPQLQ